MIVNRQLVAIYMYAYGHIFIRAGLTICIAKTVAAEDADKNRYQQTTMRCYGSFAQKQA